MVSYCLIAACVNSTHGHSRVAERGRDAVQGFQESAAAPLVCLANSGGIRADLPAGVVTYGDVTAVLPFGNFIEVLSITGTTLKAALAFGYDSVRPKPTADLVLNRGTKGAAVWHKAD